MLHVDISTWDHHSHNNIIQAVGLASLAPLLHPIGDEASNYLHKYTCMLE